MGQEAQSGMEAIKRVQRVLLPYAANAWFPWLVASLSMINTFVMILSGPLSVLFMAAALAQGEHRRRRYAVGFINAMGATVGAFAFMLIVSSRKEGTEGSEGEEWAEWERTQRFLEQYLVTGIVFYSALPVMLPPMIYFVLKSELVDRFSLVLCILFGRTIKYCVMSELAYQTYACGKDYDTYLKLFGIKSIKELNGGDNNQKPDLTNKKED